jgi:prevent-host-death family protein
MKTINATEAKNRFGWYLQMSIAEPIFIEKNRRPSAVLLSFEEYEKLKRLEDLYWAKKALKAEKEGYLGEPESLKVIQKTKSE